MSGAPQDAAMMRAVCVTKKGAVGDFASCLEMCSVPIPAVNSDEVLVRVHAAALNPIDYKMAIGYMEMVVSYPFKAGFDFSGVIVKTGAACSRLRVGDEVYGMSRWQNTGTLADYFSIKEACVALKPPSLSHVDAAGVPLAALTSYQSLGAGAVKPGDRVLILGGSGGTGYLGIQFAKAMGATVTATGSDEAFLRSCGADEVINYKTTDWTDSCANANFDVIFDTVGGYESWDKCKRNSVLKSSGHYCTIAGDFSAPVSVGNILQIAASRINRAFWSWTLDPTYHDVIADPNASDLDKVTEMIGRGLVRTRADSHFTMDSIESVVQAVNRMSSKRAKGKILIQVAPAPQDPPTVAESAAI